MRSGIDLNCDLGEAGDPLLSQDRFVIPHISSANIACGGHAGSRLTMVETVRCCVAEGVVVGAHPGYRDRENFGRVSVQMDPEVLTRDVLGQLNDLMDVAGTEGTTVRYVKPHGALYHDASSRPEIARAVVSAVLAAGADLAILAPPRALFGAFAREAGLATYIEAFADRAYKADGTLVERSHPSASFDDPSVIAERAVRIARDHTIDTVDGTDIEIHADSICLHGDALNAAAVAAGVSTALVGAGLALRAFAT